MSAPAPASARVARAIRLALCISALSTAPALGQVNYARAEQLLTWNATRLIMGDVVLPNWLADGTRFWYRSTTPRGAEFVLVDPAAKTRRLLFENDRLAAAMSLANDTTYDPVKLPFDTLELIDQDQAIRAIRIKASGKALHVRAGAVRVHHPGHAAQPGAVRRVAGFRVGSVRAPLRRVHPPEGRRGLDPPDERWRRVLGLRTGLSEAE